MNAKHYVSLEVAKMLKEKEYDRECISYYHDNCTEVDYSFCGERNSTWEERCVSAPTLLEAMDWMEERRIRIELQYSDYYHLWYSTIKLPSVTITGMGYYADRNECMNETIKKGLELL